MKHLIYLFILIISSAICCSYQSPIIEQPYIEEEQPFEQPSEEEPIDNPSEQHIEEQLIPPEDKPISETSEQQSTQYEEPIVLDQPKVNNYTIYIPINVKLESGEAPNITYFDYDTSWVYRRVILNELINGEVSNISGTDLWADDNSEYLTVSEGRYKLCVEWVDVDNGVAYGGYTIIILVDKDTNVCMNLKEYLCSVVFEVEIVSPEVIVVD